MLMKRTNDVRAEAHDTSGYQAETFVSEVEVIDPDRIIAAARSWLRTPYHDQASLQVVGCDCLGLARGVWREVVGSEPFPIPPYSRDWGESGPREVLAEGARPMMPEIAPVDAPPGALILFRMMPRAIAKHDGIMTGPDTFLNAYERFGVIEEPLTITWRRRIAFGLAVIDCDIDSAELVARMEARFGEGPVHVKTPRGAHLYYRAAGAVPNLRGEGLPVDIKTGPRSYVMGPLSLRPDGGFYDPVKGRLGVDVLPILRAVASPAPGPILTGHRHVELVKEAVRMVELVDSADELQANLAGIRDGWCVDPVTMPDSELRDIAGWAWTCRLENRIYRGRDSAFPVQRLALDALRGLANGADAIALLVLLVDQHGHTPGKRFPLDFDAMRAAGLLNLSTPRLRAARRTLEGAGLLRLAGRHRAGSTPQTFTLNRPQPGISGAVNVLPLPNAQRA